MPTDGFVACMYSYLKFKAFLGHIYFSCHVPFHIEIFKNGVLKERFSPGFITEGEFLRSFLLLRGCRTPEEWLSGATFPREVKAALAWFSFPLERPQKVRFPENSELISIKLLPKKSAKNMLSGNSCSWEKSWNKAHLLDGCDV
jgi:hypothetical protein